MSSVRKAWGTMRIAALPLTRTRPSLPPITPITYYSFQIRPAPSPPPSKDSESSSSGWLPKEGVVKWATLKVDATWTAWGKAETGTWRLRVFEFGERFLDKLEFEETTLKRIDVENAPPAKISDELTGMDREEAEALWAQLKVPLLYPPSVSSAPRAIADFEALISQRIPLHNKGFYKYLLIAPLTAPFMIIPVIPNLPFFFCAYRAYSHYQALRGARHIDGLLKAGKIVPQADASLDAVYEDIPSRVDANAKREEEEKPTLMVTRDSLGHAMRTLEMEPDETKEVLRAYEQAVNRLRSPPSALASNPN